MVIVDEIEFRTQKSQEEISGELQSFLNSWKEKPGKVSIPINT